MGLLRHGLLKRLNETHNDSPAEAVRPFDADAAGTVLAGGGGLLILEEYEGARARGAKIYAELVGFAATQDSYKITEPDPTGRSYARAISGALKDAALSVADVDLLIPNGLGIPLHDRAELAGLKTAFGSRLPEVPMALTKAQTGSLAAASGVEAAAAARAIYSGKIPPSVNTIRPINGAKLNVSRQARDAKIKVSMSSVYSLGGQNAALVFRAIPVS
jgi:3-oxoacyl-[acyl-carrier-protein] synthase II